MVAIFTHNKSPTSLLQNNPKSIRFHLHVWLWVTKDIRSWANAIGNADFVVSLLQSSKSSEKKSTSKEGEAEEKKVKKEKKTPAAQKDKDSSTQKKSTKDTGTSPQRTSKDGKSQRQGKTSSQSQPGMSPISKYLRTGDLMDPTLSHYQLAS